MKIIVALGHPAHYHLFKYFIRIMSEKGHIIKIVITDKDILKELLENDSLSYSIIAVKKANESIFDKIRKIYISTKTIIRIAYEFKPDLMIGSLSQPAFASIFINVPYIFMGEDDINYTILQGLITYPFVSRILAPLPTKVGIFSYKKSPYHGYQKLAYLHVKRFTPDITKLKSIDLSKPYYLIRLVSLDAHHDLNAKGFTEEVLDKLIQILIQKGNVYISSEKRINPKYASYKIPIDVNLIHHMLYFASIYVGDSQSMALEAAVLGVPSVRFNTFAGRISVLSELENKYKLTVSINANEPNKLYSVMNEYLSKEDLKQQLVLNRNLMLNEKVDVTGLIVWYTENYPNSISILKNNPNFCDF